MGMFSLIADFTAILLGVVLPVLRTWKVLRSRRSSRLVSLAKYWIVVAVCYIGERVLLDLLCLRSIIPAYSFLRLGWVFYLLSGGYDHVYQKHVKRILEDYEPSGEKILSMVARLLPAILGRLLSVENGGDVPAMTAAAILTDEDDDASVDSAYFQDEDVVMAVAGRKVVRRHTATTKGTRKK